MNTQLLNRLAECVAAVNATNKKNDKLAALPAFEDVKDLLRYTYDIYKPFRVTSKAIKKSDIGGNDSVYANKPIFDLLDDLTKGTLSGHAAIAAVKGFIEDNKAHEELIFKIIDKDLKLGCNISTMNKAFPKLIPHFQVSLGSPYKDHMKKVTFDGQWLASHKLDGIRCICAVRNGEVKFYTRKGHEILTLDNLRPSIEALDVNDIIFDGELCIVDDNDVEDFRAISKVWNKKNFTIPSPSYKMFDMLTIEEFEAQTSDRIFSDRIELLESVVPAGDKTLRVLEQVRVTEETFEQMQAEFREKGWEGLILRKDTKYVGKRSNDLLKMKDFHDGEFEVLGVATDVFPKLNKETGVVGFVDGIKSVYIDFNGVRVDVGSGLKLEERERFLDGESLVGKTITVQYFETTENDQGTVSMRFPTLKWIHGESRDA